MRIDIAIEKLKEMLKIDPDAEIEVLGPDDRYYDIELYSDEQDSEEYKYQARRLGHPIIRAVFEVK